MSNNSCKDFNAYDNMPEVRMSVMMNQRKNEPLNQFNEESQVLALGSNREEEEEPSGVINQGYYQHFKGPDAPIDQIQERKLQQNLKGESELYIDGTFSSNFFRPS